MVLTLSSSEALRHSDESGFHYVSRTIPSLARLAGSFATSSVLVPLRVRTGGQLKPNALFRYSVFRDRPFHERSLKFGQSSQVVKGRRLSLRPRLPSRCHRLERDGLLPQPQRNRTPRAVLVREISSRCPSGDSPTSPPSPFRCGPDSAGPSPRRRHRGRSRRPTALGRPTTRPRPGELSSRWAGRGSWSSAASITQPSSSSRCAGCGSRPMIPHGVAGFVALDLLACAEGID